MFIYTFHCRSFSCVLDYLSDIDILYCCRHYGKDKNNIEIKNHYHIISKFDLNINYDGVYTFKNHVLLKDAKRFKDYCENEHCEQEIIRESDLFLALIDSIDTKSYNIDDLIKEIVYNSENQIIKSHSYYLKKYGKVYLFNFKKIREMFDYSSAFYDWTDTSSSPQRS